MNPRCTFLLTGSLLLIAIVFLTLSFFIGDGTKSQKQFELPEVPKAIEIKPPAVKSVDLANENLFHPLRGSAVPPKEEKTATPSPVRLPLSGKLELTGIFLFGDMRGAIITGAEQPKVAGKKPVKPKQLYREGDSIGGGYVVQKIEKDHTVLIRGSEKTVLLLHKKEKKP